MENFQTILAVITAVVALLGTIYRYIVFPIIQQKTTKEQRDSVLFWAKLAVLAAEQMFPQAKTGEAKKQMVLEFMNSKGFTITKEELDIIVEAVVKEMNLNKEIWFTA